MPQNQYMPKTSVAYFFNRSKDVNTENNISILTLFARLTREITYDDGINIYSKVDTIWVDIEDIQLEKATESMKSLPNGMQEYTVTEEVFHALVNLSKVSPRELYCLTPFHREAVREKFIQ
ncbi:hypothetical protein FQV26_09615 [Planococcus sp. CPCC 101016]|uniref:hypothetical protein n=1 Tax=Planococcus sp. CPCC 101016 TaxID=2599617 RepID=UPI0011B3587C|nr:hypothetical protein [Planococcus sp. CPCC 101016]TWT08047.1 hypothetical protein FQV26_09615 [Planococcus sp. CPCC 101016]